MVDILQRVLDNLHREDYICGLKNPLTKGG